MKLSQLAARPKLIAISIDDEELVAKYGEPIEFYTWDRQPLEVFMKLAVASTRPGEDNGIVSIVRTMMLDEHGKEIIVDGVMPPSDVLIAAIGRITSMLGK